MSVYDRSDRNSSSGDRTRRSPAASSLSRPRLYHLTDVPLRCLRHSLWWVRKTFFTRSRSAGPSIVLPSVDVDATRSEVTRTLGRRHFEPGWELSYSYRGEVLNLRRVEYVDHPSGFVWWQLHLRGYEHAEGLELTAHFETEPTEHPDEHVSLFGLDVERGIEALTALLDEEGIEHAPCRRR